VEDPGAGTTDGALKKRVTALLRRVSWQGCLAGVVVVALLVLAGERSMAWRDQRQQVADEKAAAAAATAEVDGLIDISGSTSKTAVDKLLAGATAEFRHDLETQADSLRKALTENKVTATGDVVSTGVVKLDDGRATVIVAAAGSVKNKQAKSGQPRNYRLKVDLQQDGGRWLVSGLEFVA
jgi:Mce-associated membrane protein